MFIDIKDIAAEGKRVAGDLDLGILPWKQEETIEVAKASFEAFFHWTEKGLSLKGKAHLSVGLVCSRCLERFYISIEPNFILHLKEEGDQAEAANKEVDEEEIDNFPIKDSLIDMREVLSEQIYLNIPLKPLCKEECRGLCSECGGNLNENKCSCSNKK